MMSKGDSIDCRKMGEKTISDILFGGWNQPTTKLPPIAKDQDGKLYWVEPWHILPSGITLEQLTRKAIRDYLTSKAIDDLYGIKRADEITQETIQGVHLTIGVADLRDAVKILKNRIKQHEL